MHVNSEWLTAAEAAAILGVTAGHLTWLVQQGHLSAGGDSRRRLYERESVERRADEMARWISYAEASRIAECNPGTIAAAVRSGLIEQRPQRHRREASLSRESVEQWAVARRRRLAVEAEQRATRRAEGLERLGPPDDGQVWFDTATTAAILGISRSRVGQLVRAGRIPYVRRGGRVWIKREDAEQAAAARAFRARQEAWRRAAS